MAVADASSRMEDLHDAVGAWTSLTDPAVAEIAAGAGLRSAGERGFDFVVIDTEHAPLGLETVADCLRAVAAGGGSDGGGAASETSRGEGGGTAEAGGEGGAPEAIVRVPWNDPVRIKRLLDLGPDGLLVPMVNTAAEAREAVAATRYPPDGERGVAAARASDYGRNFEAYVRGDHRELTLVVQVETETAVRNSDAIAAVDGVDGLFVGPADLSASLGAFADWTDEAFLDAIETVVDAGEGADVAVGTLGATSEQVRALGSLGFDFVVAGVDVSHLVEGQRRALSAARDVL